MRNRAENWSSIIDATRNAREEVQAGRLGRVEALTFTAVVGREVAALRGEMDWERHWNATKSAAKKAVTPKVGKKAAGKK
jgi:hypothetical protein